MQRVQLDNGGWMDVDRAQVWEEDTYFDGHNHISVVTRSQWAHERLYRSRKGTWVLKSWSQYQAGSPSWRVISEGTAHKWLFDNGYHAEVPADLLASWEC